VNDGEETSVRPRFRVSCKELIGIPGVKESLKFPLKIGRFWDHKRICGVIFTKLMDMELSDASPSVSSWQTLLKRASWQNISRLAKMGCRGKPHPRTKGTKL